jgi:hypothetical protein
MSHKAEPRADISEPPAYPVLWLVIWDRTKSCGATEPNVIKTVVRHRTWFDARAEAMLMGAEANELTIIQGKRDSVEHDGLVYALKDGKIKVIGHK